jgi:hypothetical protein
VAPDEDAAPTQLKDDAFPLQQLERFRDRALADGILAHQLLEDGQFISLLQIVLIDVLLNFGCNLLIF